jgi:xanthine dehydrogenase accessory factor
LSVDEDQIALRNAHAAPGAALCTIVGIDGSFSRRKGGQLAIRPDGRTFGSLSDGCLEKELAAQALSLKILGKGPALLRFGKGSPFIDFRLPCGSGLDILLDPDPDQAAIAHTVAELDARRSASLALPEARPDLLRDRYYIPSLRLLICGAGPEALWLQSLASNLGVSTAILGPDHGLHLGRAPAWIELDRWTAVTLLFHDHEWEQEILEWALASNAFYIGAMGGKRTREIRQDRLATAGFTDTEIARIHSPIGLIKRARDARLLALSVLSEISQNYEAVREARCS